MNFKEELERAKNLKIDILALEIAYEVDAADYTPRLLSDEDFEQVCSIVEYYYLKIDDVTISNIVNTVFTLIDEGKKIYEIANMRKSEFIDELIFN